MSDNYSTKKRDLVSRVLERKNTQSDSNGSSDANDLVSRVQKRKEREEEARFFDNSEKIGSELSSRVNSWLTNSGNYINSYNRHISSTKADSFDASSREWLDELTGQKSNFDLEADNIRSILNTYGKYYDSEWVSEINKALDERGSVHEDIIKAATAWNDYFSQWDSEEAYKDALAAAANIEALRAVDLDRLQKEIAYMEDQANALIAGMKYYNKLDPNNGNHEKLDEYSERLGTLQDRIKEKQKYYNDVKRMQEYYSLTEEAMSAWDVDSIVERYYAEREQRESSSPFGVTGARSFSPLDLVVDNKYLEDAEKRTLIYMFEKGGTDSMLEYYDKLEPYLAQREAEAIAKSKDKWWEKALFTVEVGLDQFADGIDTIFGGNHEYDVTQMASAMVREELGDVGRFFYDAATSTVNMVPSMLTSYAIGLFNPAAGAVAGATLMGASSAGNGYTQMKQLGYSDGQAMAYALMVGISEATLQYTLGGISKLGGKATNHFVSKMIARVDGVLGKAAIKLGGNMLSEGAEEALQTVLEPLFQSIVTGEEYTVPELEEIIYSGLLGAVTSFGFEAGPTVVNTVKEIRSNTAAGREILSDKSGADALMKLAHDKAYDEAGVVKTAGKLKAKLDASKDTGKISGKTARLAAKLSQGVDSARFSQNKTDVKNALIESGVNEKKAEATANAILKSMEGKELLPHEVKLLDNRVAQNVLRELKTDAESSVNLRNAEYALGRLGVSMNEDGSVVLPEGVLETDTSSAQKEKSAFNAKTSRTVNVSEDGVTRMTETGEAVKIADVASVDKNGDVYLKLENGQTVNMRDVSFSSDNEAALYEQIASFGLHPTVMKTVIDGYDASFGISPAEYLKAASIAYTFGKYNIPKRELSEALPEAVNDHIYKLGQVFTEERIQRKTERIKGKESVEERSNGKYSIRYPSYKESEIADNSIRLQEMDAVVSLSGKEFSESNDPIRLRIQNYFASLGNNVHTAEFGDVALTNSSVRDDLAHGLTYNKVVSFAAIPEVLKNGVVIDSQRRGGNNYDRIVVAAPIKISNELYYMGVMLQRDKQSQRLYLHDVLAINKEEIAKQPAGTLSTTEPSDANSNLYMTSILKKALHVNSKDMQNTSKNARNDGKLLSEATGEAFEINEDSLNDKQKAGLFSAKIISTALGMNIYVYESYLNGEGERVYRNADGKEVHAPNGFYDPKTGEIHIDLNAGKHAEGTILFTLSHELVHFIRQWSPSKFKVLADFLVKKYGEKGISVDALIKNQIVMAENDGRKLTYDGAYEEFVADSMQTMLSSGNVVENLVELKWEDKTLWEKVKEFFANMLGKLQKVLGTYKNLSTDTIEGNLVAKMKDSVSELEKLFTEGLVDASENFKKTDVSEFEISEGVKYSAVGKNSLTANRVAFVTSVILSKLKVNPETIRRNLGWYQGKDGLWRYEISDKNMTFKPDGFVDNPKYLSDYVKHDKLFDAYPDMEDIVVEFVDVIENDSKRRGRYCHGENKIIIKKGMTVSATKSTLLHEMQHAIQAREHFSRGGNHELAFGVIYNNTYHRYKDSDEYKALKTPEDRDNYIETKARESIKRNEESLNTIYRQFIGEAEARNTQNRAHLSEKELRSTKVDTSWMIYDPDAERQRTIAIFHEMGYNVHDSSTKGDEIIDESRDDGKSSHDVFRVGNAIRNVLQNESEIRIRENREVNSHESEGSGQRIYGIDAADGVHSRTASRGNGELQVRSGSILEQSLRHLENKDKIADGALFDSRYGESVSSRTILTQILEETVKDDQERTKLALYKSKISEIETLENKLEDINRQIREISFGKGPRDKEKLRSLMDEKTKTANRIDIADRQLLRLEAAKVLQNIVDRQRNAKLAASFGKTSNNKSIDQYSQKQYNDFGWARYAEAISKNELDDLYSKIQEKGSLKKFTQSGYGEAIIEVNDDPHSTLGVDNVFVFVTGTKNNPAINKVVRFDIETETEMEIIKEQLYERRTFSYTYYSFLREKGLAREYSKKSAVNYNEYSQKVRSGSSRGDSNGTYGNGGFERDGRGTLGKTSSDEVGKILFSDRSGEDVSTRGLLVNALESSTENDAEREKLAEYKSKIAEVESLENKLEDINRQIREISFGKGPRDKEKLRLIMDEKTKTANRIDIADRQLLRLEAAKVLQNIVERQRKAKTVMPFSQVSDKMLSPQYTDNLLEDFGITSPNDYIHVQKQVLSTLEKEGFFTDTENRRRTDVNKESGMVIETNKSGIDETFNDNNYGRRGKLLKYAKLATVRMLPEIIRDGHLVGDNVGNTHEGKTVQYAYIEHNVVVDGVPMTVKVDIRKSRDKNKMWVHSIHTQKNISGQGITSKDGVVTPYQTADIEDRITQNSDFVNSSEDVLFSDRSGEDVSTRGLLVNALESATENDAEREKLAEYKSKIAEIEALEGKLEDINRQIREISFSKGPRDKEKLRSLMGEKTKTANRIDIADRQLLRLEAAKVLQNIVERQRKVTRARSDDVARIKSAEKYSYESTISKPDMPITILDDSVSIDRADIISQAKKNAAAVGHTNSDGSVSVYVKDIDANVILSKSGLRHGLDRRASDNAASTIKAGEIIQNAIKINELIPSKEEADESYVLIGVAKNTQNKLQIVRFIVNKYSNELSSMDVLYAMNAKTDYDTHNSKKEGTAVLNAPPVSTPDYRTTISISELLSYVNKHFPDVLPESVLRHFGHTERPDGVIGKSVLFSDRSGEDVSTRGLLVNALESAAESDTEREKLAKYKAKIADIEALENRLNDIDRQIHDISFSKGPRDMGKLRALQEEKKVAVDRLNREDKLLLKLENAQPLKDLVDRERDKAYKRAKERANEQRERAEDKRKRTLERNAIRRIAHDLERMLNKGTREKNVKDEMKSVVRPAVDLSSVMFLDNETMARNGIEGLSDEEQEKLARYNALYDELHSTDDNVSPNVERRKELRHEIHLLDRELSAAFDAEKRRINSIDAKDIIYKLANAYAELGKSSDSYIAGAYDADVHSHLSDLTAFVGNTLIKDMSLDELKAVRRAYSMIRHKVQLSNRIFRDGKTEDIRVRVKNVQDELNELGAVMKERSDPKNPKLQWLLTKLNGFSWNNLRPCDAFERIGSDSLKELFWDVVYAQDDYGRITDEAEITWIEAQKTADHGKWNTKNAVEITLSSGKSVKLTVQERLSIYATWKREQGRAHLKGGGFSFGNNTSYRYDKKSYQHLTDESFILTDEDISLIEGELTKPQKDYADKMIAFITSLGKRGNEVSRALYGIDIFNEESYFPITVKKAEAPTPTPQNGKPDKGTTSNDNVTLLKNVGMAQMTQKGADGEIVIRPFDDVVCEHIDTMAKYCAYVLPIENLTRVFDERSSKLSENGISTTALIKKMYGESAVKYVKNYINDLNGRTPKPGGMAMKLFNNSKKAAVSLNLSVIAQQPLSIARAAAEIDTKYLLLAKKSKLPKGGDTLQEEMEKFAPVVKIKAMGRFDIGNSSSLKNYIGYEATNPKSWSRIKKVADDVMSFLPSWGDRIAWQRIYLAVKYEIADKGTYKVGSEEYFKAVGRRFTEIVTKTQVYDSVNTRSGLMRSDRDLDRFATTFSGEPTTHAGMAYIAALKYYRAHLLGRDTKAAGKFLVRTMAALSVTSIFASLVVGLVRAMRDDDEDEAFLEKWANAFAAELKEAFNPLEYLPYVRDVVSVFEGYTVDRPDMTLIINLARSVNGLIDGEITDKDVESALFETANLGGIPLKNVARDIKAITNLIVDMTDDVYPTDIVGAFDRGFSNKELTRSEAIYRALKKGDTGRLKVIRKSYKDDASYESAVKKAIRENDRRVKKLVKELNDSDFSGVDELVDTLVSELGISEVTAAEVIYGEYTYFCGRVSAAAEAMNNGNDGEYKKILKTLKERYSGIYTKSEIASAINEKAEQLANAETYDEEENVESIYRAWQVNASLEEDDTDTANMIIDDLIQVKVENYMSKAEKEAEKNGTRYNENKSRKEAEAKAKSAVRSSVTRYWKERYQEAWRSNDADEMARIRRLLTSTGLYGSAYETSAVVREWLKEAAGK